IVYSLSVDRRALFLLGLGIIVLSLCIFNTLGIRAGFRKLKGDLTFHLIDTELIGKRTGGREVRIPFSDIVSLRERFGWLTVLAASPARKIAIPKDVEGYDFIKAELSKYAEINTGPVFHKAAISPLVLLSIVVWWLLLGSANLRIKQIAAVAAVSLLLLSSFRILRITKESAKVPSRVLIAAAWIAALVLIYERIFVA